MSNTTLRRHEPHWLYRMFNDAGELLYIGVTVNPKTRMSQWRTRSNANAGWFRSVVRIDWQQYANWTAVTRAEREAIADEQPRFNTLHRVAA
jgi:excinuclease UvrABC nuclease subunit